MNITYTFELGSRPDRLGLYQVFLRITANRKHSRLKTGIHLSPEQFDKKPAIKNNVAQWVIKHPEKVKFNLALSKFLETAKTVEKETESSSTDSIKRNIQRPPGSITIKEYAEEVVATIRASYHYKKHLKSKLTTFSDFAGEGSLLSSINLDLLNRFKRHLAAIPVSSSTQHYYFSRIKRMVTLALNDELIPRDPFLKFEMPPERPGHRAKLSDKQILAIEEVECAPHSWLWRAKWLYLFSFRKAGMRSADVIQLRVGNLKENNRLEYQMDKTGKLMSLKLTETDWRIIKLFGNPEEATNKTNYLFGLLDNDAPYTKYVTYAEKQRMPEEIDTLLYNKISSIQTQINKNLKKLATLAEIDEKITFHTARHSFADKARRRMKESKNISIDDIRNSLGHTRLDTTQRYLDSFDREGLDSAMDAVFGE